MACCGKKPFNRVQQAVSLTATLGRAAFAFIKGKPVFSTEEMITARLKICARCGYFQNNPLGCRICKCPNFRAKLALVASACPDGDKWKTASENL